MFVSARGPPTKNPFLACRLSVVMFFKNIGSHFLRLLRSLFIYYSMRYSASAKLYTFNLFWVFNRLHTTIIQADHLIDILFHIAPGKNLYLLCFAILSINMCGALSWPVCTLLTTLLPLLCTLHKHIVCYMQRAVCVCAFICILHAINHFIQCALSVRSVRSSVLGA